MLLGELRYCSKDTAHGMKEIHRMTGIGQAFSDIVWGGSGLQDRIITEEEMGCSS